MPMTVKAYVEFTLCDQYKCSETAERPLTGIGAEFMFYALGIEASFCAAAVI